VNGIAFVEYNSNAGFTATGSQLTKYSPEKKISKRIANSMLSVALVALPVASQIPTHNAPYVHYNNNTKQNNYSSFYTGGQTGASKVKLSHRNVVIPISQRIAKFMSPNTQEVIGGKYKTTGEVHSFDFEMDFVQNIKYPKFDPNNVLKKSPID
jgi:hypothetical protein